MLCDVQLYKLMYMYSSLGVCVIHSQQRVQLYSVCDAVRSHLFRKYRSKNESFSKTILAC